MTKIGRRSFLIGSAALAGGVAFGIVSIGAPPANPLERELGMGETSFNPWIRISPQGITLIAPHTDLGQGARSIQAALIAEEMDLEFGQFTVEPGPPDAAYWNTKAANDVIPFRHSDSTLAAEASRVVAGSALKLMGVQATGGSSTVADSYHKLRTAGAIARETLKRTAALRTGVPVRDLRTEKGAVILPNGSSIEYTELAREASNVDVVQEVSLRDPGQWRLLGKDMLRLDVVGKSTGTLNYGIDLVMEGMRNATVRFNPRQGGVMHGYDTAAAQDMPGVIRILEVTNGIAVVADNTWNAFQAADTIRFDCGAAPYHSEMEQHWAEISAAFVETRQDWEWLHDGDVPEALASRSIAIDREYRAPYLAHAPLEPIGAVIKVTGQRADIWVAHQLPRFAQDLVADITGLGRDKVHLHNQYCGGSFGHRLEFENIRYAAEIGTQMKGTPIKLTFSREEDFAHDYVRQISMCRIQGDVADGHIQTLDISVAGPSVNSSQVERIGFPFTGPDVPLAAGVWTAPYSIPNYRVRTYRVPRLAPVSSWRSVGASTGGFFMETAMDELILAAGADPLEERLRLCKSSIAQKVLEAVAEMCDWHSDPGPDRGRGLALVVSFGTTVAEVVEVSNTPQGIRMDRVCVAADAGRVLDPVNFRSQVEGGVIWGLGHAMNCEITYSDGMAQQTNYHQFEGMRMYQCPLIEIRTLENNTEIKGIGEPPVPPAAPALGNAIFAATGTRLREMPFNKFVKFV